MESQQEQAVHVTAPAGEFDSNNKELGGNEHPTATPETDIQLLRLLEDTAVLMELNDENAFKVGALRNAVRVLEAARINVAEAVDNGTVSHVQGIGKGLQELIAEYVATGSLKVYEELRTIIPDGVFEMTSLRGLGAKKVRTLWKELGVTDILALQAACNENRVATLKGFGTKSQANIATAIQQWRDAQARFHLHKALDDAEILCSRLKTIAGVELVELAGDARRCTETVSELRIIVAAAETTKPQAIAEQFVVLSSFALEIADATDINGAANVTLYGLSDHNIPAHIDIVPRRHFARHLHEATGSAAYLKWFERNAKRNAKRNPSGDKPSDDMPQAASDERAFYHAAGIPYIPPERREERFEGEDDADDIVYIPENPDDITLADVRGMLHVHSTWSDGRHSIREMAEASAKLGCTYMAICDHSKSAVYANGLSEERVKRQHEEIDHLNEAFAREGAAIRVLKGIESDILASGALDYSDAVLETFEVVVASVHSRFSMSREAMTERVVRALQHPATTLLGHPTGRLLLARPGYELEMERIIETAAQHGKALEINCNPHRLDLTWQNARAAQQAGVRLAINTDAHNAPDLRYIRLGVSMARKAGLKKSNVINTFSVKDFAIFVKTSATISAKK